MIDWLKGLRGGPRTEGPAKAVTGGAYLAALQSGPLLSMLHASPQDRAAKYLAAYKVGWFHKAGRKISLDVAGLPVTLSYEDSEGDNAEAITTPAAAVPFERLDPLQQFLRLMEQPNRYQTGRALRQKTQIRCDFAGAAFWFLEGGEGGDLPTAIYGISPARMTPSLSKTGTLIGWVMDADDRGGGVPFSPDEILPFIVPGAGDELWAGQGVVEAVFAQVPLTEQLARHTSDVLATGGRLAGMITPKNRALTESEFQDVVKAWRNVASDPNAARRLLVFPEPMEWAQGAASPKDIGIPELATLSRDEILTAFPISPYQLGVPMPGGLNSAETRREDRRDYWEGSIHPRVEFLEDTIQAGLMPRYEAAVGRPLDCDVEEPNLDDAPTIIEKVGAYKGLVSIGMDPKEAVTAVGLDHIKWNGLPDLLDPAKQAMAAEEATQVSVRDTTNTDSAVTQQRVVGKTRDSVTDRVIGAAQPLLADFLRDQRERVIAKITEVWPARKADRKAVPPDWWDAAAEDAGLSATLSVLYRDVAKGSLQVVADQLDRLIRKDQHLPIAEDILRSGGTRITQINETTRQAISDLLTTGATRGYSIAQLVEGVEAEAFPGIRSLLLDNGQEAWADLRAETIARTETGYAYNQAAVGGYRELGVRQVQVYDGDKDDICSPWDGWIGPIDEAPEPLGHPNCTRDFAPAGFEKAVTIEDPMPPVTVINNNYLELSDASVGRLAETFKANAPIVNVPEAQVSVTVEPTPVTITVPEQKVPVVNVKAEPVVYDFGTKATAVQDVRLVESLLPPKRRKVKRDQFGRIVEMTEE